MIEKPTEMANQINGVEEQKVILDRNHIRNERYCLEQHLNIFFRFSCAEVEIVWNPTLWIGYSVCTRDTMYAWWDDCSATLPLDYALCVSSIVISLSPDIAQYTLNLYNKNIGREHMWCWCLSTISVTKISDMNDSRINSNNHFIMSTNLYSCAAARLKGWGDAEWSSSCFLWIGLNVEWSDALWHRTMNCI